MKPAAFRSIGLALLALLVLGTGALHSSSVPAPARRPAGLRALPRVDAAEALRRARLEQNLIQAEKTAVLLGELVAQEGPR